MSTEATTNPNLVLAAEDFEPSDFELYHRFSPTDERMLAKLMAHGPVLIRGGRGSGKSALMVEAERRLKSTSSHGALGLYISLRHLELIRTSGKEYESFLCRLLSKRLQEEAGVDVNCSPNPSVAEIQYALAEISTKLSKRIVLLFDDAAHIGREASLAEFFDVFRTISSSTVSCKAAIYPGVTRFGTRFDVFSDATVLDLSRSDELDGHSDFFAQIMELRSGGELPDTLFSGTITKNQAAGFLGAAVLGNMRSFIFACNTLAESNRSGPMGIPDLTATLLSLSGNYYWPLLEEVRPKLGPYLPMVDIATEIASIMFEICGKERKRSVLVFREIAERLAKPLEILEYAGFIAKREASRAMKSGGRGARYALNFCNLVEHLPNARLSIDVFRGWMESPNDPVQFHRGSALQNVETPTEPGPEELGILSLGIEKLAKSNAYPYGLTEAKEEVLKSAGILTVGDLAEASDETLLKLDGVGPVMLKRFRNIVGQAIWM